MDETSSRTLMRCLTALAAVLIMALTTCSMHLDYRISEDIRNGAHPITAYCAHSANNNSSVCGSAVMRTN